MYLHLKIILLIFGVTSTIAKDEYTTCVSHSPFLQELTSEPKINCAETSKERIYKPNNEQTGKTLKKSSEENVKELPELDMIASGNFNNLGSNTYGMDITGDHGYVWNNLVKPEIRYNVGNEKKSFQTETQHTSHQNTKISSTINDVHDNIEFDNDLEHNSRKECVKCVKEIPSVEKKVCVECEKNILPEKSFTRNAEAATEFKYLEGNQIEEAAKTYGFKLAGDNGYVWNNFVEPGIHYNVGKTETNNDMQEYINRESSKETYTTKISNKNTEAEEGFSTHPNIKQSNEPYTGYDECKQNHLNTFKSPCRSHETLATHEVLPIVKENTKETGGPINFNNSEDKIQEAPKTYGMKLEGDHGYVWNNFITPGVHYDVGKVGTINSDSYLTRASHSEYSPNNDLNVKTSPFETHETLRAHEALPIQIENTNVNKIVDEHLVKPLESIRETGATINLDKIEEAPKTYGMKLDGAHGYVWNNFITPGVHYNVGKTGTTISNNQINMEHSAVNNPTHREETHIPSVNREAEERFASSNRQTEETKTKTLNEEVFKEHTGYNECNNNHLGVASHKEYSHQACRNHETTAHEVLPIPTETGAISFNYSEDNIKEAPKTYGIKLERDHGYVWNNFIVPGIHYNVGKMESTDSDHQNYATHRPTYR